jgi:hypothetical protein
VFAMGTLGSHLAFGYSNAKPVDNF